MFPLSYCIVAWLDSIKIQPVTPNTHRIYTTIPSVIVGHFGMVWTTHSEHGHSSFPQLKLNIILILSFNGAISIAISSQATNDTFKWLNFVSLLYSNWLEAIRIELSLYRYGNWRYRFSETEVLSQIQEFDSKSDYYASACLTTRFCSPLFSPFLFDFCAVVCLTCGIVAHHQYSAIDNIQFHSHLSNSLCSSLYT